MRTRLQLWAAGVGATGALLAWALVSQRGAPGSLLPHGYCFTWNPTLLWTHVASDSMIGLAYVSIPLTLVQLARKRDDLPFDWIVLLFAVFIVSCGATHWIEVWTVWRPDYWLSASVKAVTAVASLLTAVSLWWLLPRILAIPSVHALRSAKQALEIEVAQRREAEAALERQRATLEERVRERTEELARATAAAEASRETAQEANRLKDRFLSKVSHELRTPLQSTLTWAQVMQASTDPAQSAHAASRVVHNVRSQARLIDDLLDISRILSGKLLLELSAADVGEVIRKAVEVATSASDQGKEIELLLSDEAMVVRTDPVRLEQVVWNLVNNAVEATRDGGRIRLTARRSADVIVVEVQDSGRGIVPTDLPNIFEPFKQTGDHANRHRGLGLGLAITQSIVGLLGGTVQAQSAGLGQGATFTVTLPAGDTLVSPSAGDVHGALSAAERRRLASLRVLYVEDDLEILQAGTEMLSALGIDVLACSGFAEAAAHISAGDFDVLLTDLDLGAGRSGLELLPLLQGSSAAARPALVISAYGSGEDRDNARRAGFADHLVKPVDAETLARALLAATEGGRLQNSA